MKANTLQLKALKELKATKSKKATIVLPSGTGKTY